MPGDPQQGDTYRQEYYPRYALDQARVLGPGGSVTVPNRSSDLKSRGSSCPATLSKATRTARSTTRATPSTRRGFLDRVAPSPCRTALPILRAGDHHARRPSARRHVPPGVLPALRPRPGAGSWTGWLRHRAERLLPGHLADSRDGPEARPGRRRAQMVRRRRRGHQGAHRERQPRGDRARKRDEALARRRDEPVPHSPHVEDVGGLGRAVELAPQPRRMRVQRARTPERPEAPDVAQELFFLEDPFGILGERDEELVLLGGELHRLAGQSDDSGGEVDLEVAHRQARVPQPVRAAEDSTHPREQLVVDEGLHDVVVAAPREAAHAVDGIAARAHHDDGDVAVPAAPRLSVAQAAAELESGRVG